MKKQNNIFRFYTERRLVEATGLRATTIPELLEQMKVVGGASIFYHTHTSLLEHHFVERKFYNDFTTWISDSLQEYKLAEKLCGIDMMEFTSIRALREAFIKTIGNYIEEQNGESPRKAPPGEGFYFLKAKSFVFPTGHEARSVDEFFECLQHISPISLYFHVFESRLRLKRPSSDFGVWLTDMGAKDIAEKISKLDPYAYTLDELRERIITLK